MREPTRCPTCSEETLSACHLEQADARVNECAVCGGVWVPREAVQMLGSRPRTEPLPAGLAPAATVAAGARLYRRCPVCDVLMNRKRFGEVVLDVCTLHGVWFDRGELEVFVGWVREETERHLRVLPGAATARRATITSSLLALPPDPSRGSSWLDAFECVELLEPVAMVLEAVVGLLDG